MAIIGLIGIALSSFCGFFAWRKTESTKSDIKIALLFTAVIMSIVCGILSLITLISSISIME